MYRSSLEQETGAEFLTHSQLRFGPRKSLARAGAGNIGQWDWENWMAGAEIVVVNFWRIDLSIPNHVNDSCGGFGPNQQFFDTETVFAIPSHHQTYPRGRAGDEQDNGTVSCSRHWAVWALDNLVGDSVARLAHRSREKHG
jgi:hypothetical protein